MCAECERLRAQLAEVTAERDEWRAFAEGSADEEARARAPVIFTSQQWRLLTALIRAGGRPIRTEALTDMIRIRESAGDASRLADQVVFRVRQRLERGHWPRDTIRTVPRSLDGGGYYIPRETVPGLAAWLGIETRLNASLRSAA